MVAADFEVDDLVWAKMKNYPFWPAKIVNPPSNTKSTPSKKAHHYVFFFGSENYAWISDENIVHHSEEMLQSTSTKKKSTSYKSAIDKIIAESEKVPMKSRPPIKEKGESKMLTESSPVSSSERKVSKSQRGKSKYESAKKRYFVKVQKSSQNQYFAKMHKKVRKKYFTDRIKSSRSKETSSIELNGETLLGMLSTFAGKTIESTKKKIGFLGLGKMGQRIVKKLIESDHNVTVWNRTLDKCTEFVKLGAHCALTPSSVIAECDVTFCCVSGPDAVKAIVFGPDGVLVGLEGTRGKGYVELTTIDPITSEEIAEAIRHKGGTYLESPVTESKKQDKSESLVVVCSGEYDLFTNCESCFYAFASDAYFLSGEVGSGSNMNLLTSMFMNTVYAALAESLALIRKLNLSQDALLEFLKHGPLNCCLLQHKGKALASDDFFIGSTFKYQQKDLSLALSLGDFCEQPMPLTASANELYKRPIHLLYEPENGTSSGKSTAED
ncbi:Putative oxidoreductase GLYR1 [Araneus ventricosus]|uniref:Cytokine-like nuclear factor N-PAC n=1 Tax=Araneus ventricosus TaxID=182803 RepID=A0A4Y2I5A8_ARAVE|nr:Putative oxidoreductase GLYR1 [Araneus ventricosus]